MGMIDTTTSLYPYALAMGTEIGEAVTQHIPLTKAREKKMAIILYR